MSSSSSSNGVVEEVAPGAAVCVVMLAVSAGSRMEGGVCAGPGVAGMEEAAVEVPAEEPP